MSILTLGNRLSTQKSPYLLQHRDNPVWWWPWCDEAFEVARQQDKPVFLSIGYATCYWCHVMEQDSFEQKDVAELLNQHFISIKLDREERPDVDALYMDAVVGMTGQGGWPMSVFLTPDRVPFWGGTFFYQAQFMQILERLNHFWTTDREKVLHSVEQIGGFLQRRAKPQLLRSSEEEDARSRAVAALGASFDSLHGGFGSAPKFPPTGQLALLCRNRSNGGVEPVLPQIKKTLDGMAKGGLFDQLGGGFSRYSTDAAWLIPHFEKMLYDNALLVISYLEGWQLTRDRDYLAVACEALDFVLKEFSTGDGPFSSAFDAGEVGQEGEYYVWAHRDVQALLSAEEFSRFAAVYGLTPEGNFEAKNTVLAIAKGEGLAARNDALLISAREKLLQVRSLRKRPLCDDKVLASWNGLMISAFAAGYSLTGDMRYGEGGARAAQFILDTMCEEGKLFRRFRDGDVAVDGCLEDYSYLIAGLIDLALASNNYSLFEKARALQEIQDRVLWDADTGAYLASASPDLIVRRYEFSDGALPSANSIALLNLHRLGVLYGDPVIFDRARELDRCLSVQAENFPEGYCRYFVARDWFEQNAQLVIVVPEGQRLDAQQLREWTAEFRPGLMVLQVQEGQTMGVDLPLLRGKRSIADRITGYLCRGQSCLAPGHDIPSLLAHLDAS